MRDRDSIDRKFLAGAFRKLKESADVIVLVVTGEEVFGFCDRQTEGRKRNRFAKFAGLSEIYTDQIVEGHDGSAANSSSADRILLGRVYR